MDTAITKELIGRAFELSPKEGNGYGFALAVICSVSVLVVVVAGFLYRRYERYRDRQDTLKLEFSERESAKRDEARQRLEATIEKRFDEFGANNKEEFREIANAAQRLEDLVNQHSERLTRLEEWRNLTK